MKIRKGTLVGFAGTWGSGLGELMIDEERLLPRSKGGERDVSRVRIGVYCDNAPTIRALDACFGDVIAPGHTVNQEAIRGKEIYFSTDEIGVLESFTPVDQAPPEMVRIYEGGADG